MGLPATRRGAEAGGGAERRRKPALDDRRPAAAGRPVAEEAVNLLQVLTQPAFVLDEKKPHAFTIARFELNQIIAGSDSREGHVHSSFIPAP